MNKPGVMIYFTMRPSRKLPMEDRLRLYDAMLDYGETGVVPELDGPLAVLWDYFQPQLELDNARYESPSGPRRGGWGARPARAPGSRRVRLRLSRQKQTRQRKQKKQTKQTKPIQYNPVQYNPIQSSTVQSSSITGEYSGQGPSRPQEEVCPPYSGRDRGLCPGGKAYHGPSGICGLLHRQRLEGRQPRHEGLACRRPELGPEGGPYAPAAPSARPHCPGPFGGPLRGHHLLRRA